MKLPVIRSLVDYAETDSKKQNISVCIEVIEQLSSARGWKEEEIVVLGEIMSNLYGSLNVISDIESGTSKSEALNSFMKRVMGSIDRK